MARVHNVFDGDGTIKVGAGDKLPEQIEFVYRLASESIGRINELEEDVAELRAALIELGGPAYAERFGRHG